MTSHELAKKLLELPDRRIAIVKAEGGPYTSEYDLHPAGPWLTNPDHAFNPIRIQIQGSVNDVQTAR